MSFQTFHCSEEGFQQYDAALKFWSNACGDLHHHGKEDLSVEELPEELQRAYYDLWGENYGALCYLVETPKGYGVALICEYDKVTAEYCRDDMDLLFRCAEVDGKTIAEHEAFKNADVFVSEYGGFDDCHELVVVFPADTPIEEFEDAAEALENLAYCEPMRLYNKFLCTEIGHYFGCYFEEDGLCCIDNGEKVFQYETPEALLVDWVDTLVDAQHDDPHPSNNWEKEIQHIYRYVAKKFPVGVRPSGIAWQCSVDVPDPSNPHGKNLHLGTYRSIVDAIYARKDFLAKTDKMQGSDLEALMAVAKEQQEQAKAARKEFRSDGELVR